MLKGVLSCLHICFIIIFTIPYTLMTLYASSREGQVIGNNFDILTYMRTDIYTLVFLIFIFSGGIYAIKCIMIILDEKEFTVKY